MHGGREGMGGGGGRGGGYKTLLHCLARNKTESRDYRENWYPKL